MNGTVTVAALGEISALRSGGPASSDGAFPSTDAAGTEAEEAGEVAAGTSVAGPSTEGDGAAQATPASPVQVATVLARIQEVRAGGRRGRQGAGHARTSTGVGTGGG
ncbi:MAG: hypothetical protein JW751_27710 [Polyangiaceae bacterium]|nr:hypothetical protein [Polyangiaceae bacterium]